jgi:hypothetical protein
MEVFRMAKRQNKTLVKDRVPSRDSINAKKQIQISSSVAQLVSFIKENTASNLVESSRGGHLEALNDKEIERVISVVNQSVDQALSLGYSSVEAAVISALNEN